MVNLLDKPRREDGDGSGGRPDAAFTDAGDQLGNEPQRQLHGEELGPETKLFRPDPLAD